MEVGFGHTRGVNSSQFQSVNRETYHIVLQKLFAAFSLVCEVEGASVDGMRESELWRCKGKTNAVIGSDKVWLFEKDQFCAAIDDGLYFTMIGVQVFSHIFET